VFSSFHHFTLDHHSSQPAINRKFLAILSYLCFFSVAINASQLGTSNDQVKPGSGRKTFLERCVENAGEVRAGEVHPAGSQLANPSALQICLRKKFSM